jgi:uncharacterized iron-regulated membrane protein
MSVRRAIFNTHLYAALITGSILIVIAVTGCLLVFELQMDRWLDPKVSYVEPQGNRFHSPVFWLDCNRRIPARRSRKSILANLTAQ